MLALVDKVRGHLRKCDYIDPELESEDRKKKNRPDSLRMGALMGADAAVIFGERIESWQQGAGKLLGSPRVLKGMLANLVERWAELQGEIDLDELIMYLVLQNGAPQACDFLSDNIQEIRQLSTVSGDSQAGGKSSKQELIDDLKGRWDNTVIARARFEVRAAASILFELFPSIGPVVRYSSYLRGDRVQSISHEDGALYLNRIISGEVEAGAVRDQDALKILTRTARGEGGAETLARAVMMDARIGQRIMIFETKLNLLSQVSRLAVISEFLKRVREREGRGAGLGVDDLFGMHLWIPRLGGNVTELADWYQREIDVSLPGHLNLAVSLLAGAMEHESDVGEKRVLPAAQSLLSRKLKTLSGGEFAACFDKSHPHTLWRLLELGTKKRGGVPNEFAWLGPPILAALKQAQDVMVPQVVTAFRGKVNHEDRIDFFEAQMAEFFQGAQREVYAIIAGFVPTDDLQNGWRREFESAASAAKEKLARSPGSMAASV